MTDPSDTERAAIERDRDLAWELYEAQPQHPLIPQLARSVLARVPEFTGMIVLLAMHHEACGEVEPARRLLRDLVGRRDRQFLNALRELRDLEYGDQNYAEALRLADLVLQEAPETTWRDLMDRGSALAFVEHLEEGWQQIDDAVDLCARIDPDRYGGALGQRATLLLASGAPPERFLPAAEEAVAADPSETLLATTLAYAYLYDYRPDRAAELLGRVLREDPTDELAQGGMTVARAFLDPIERGAATIEEIRAVGMGEIAWRRMRDMIFETALDEALAALDAVMPAGLAGSLRPPLDPETAKASGGDPTVLAWHDGQEPGAGDRWGIGEPFRLMSGREVDEMDDAIERDPDAWPQWDSEGEYYSQILTDDAGAYLIEGWGGRLYRRGPAGTAGTEVAPSLADWVWDRVAAFGGQDPRPVGSRR
ncbi:tetratricopeptide repeat protein [Propionicicella superfundia]|uniref:tetratricopeptide repeat protein n=1 Tax=Propionicicella superfundia TaxID=348582 RepID=UPI0004165E4D|nr:hypothetical protein [Propionicicella superfundia]